MVVVFFLFPRIYGRLFLAWLFHSWQPAAPPYREWRKRFHRFFWAAFFKRDFCFFWVLKSAAANGLCFFSLNLLFLPLRDVFFCVCVGVCLVVVKWQVRCKRFSRLECIQVFNDATTPFCDYSFRRLSTLDGHSKQLWKSKKSVGNTASMLEYSIQVMNGSLGVLFFFGSNVSYIHTHCSSAPALYI